MRIQTSKPTYALCATVALALALTVGCGGGGESTGGGAQPASDAPARVELCGLLAESDIEDVLGSLPGAASEGDDALGYCEWASGADASAAPVVVLTLEKAALGSFDDFIADFGEEFGGEDPPRDRFHPIEDLGEWAMYVADDHMARVFKGDVVLEVSATGAEEELVVDLARRATARWN